MINPEKESDVLKIFKKREVITILQLVELLDCSVPTVRIRLKKWRSYTSYNQNGRYYVLPNIPKFDEYGLWKYRNIFFSRYGNLKQTVIHLVGNSKIGLDASEIGKMVELSPRSFMTHFQDIEGLCREKHEGKFIYFSDKESIYTKQKRKRESALKEKLLSLPSDTVAIAILVDLIKHPGSSPEKCIQRLRTKNIHIKTKTLQNFLQHHGIKKKLWL